MQAPQDYGHLATSLAEMARDLVNQQSIQATLDSIVTHAVELVEGCDAAGIMAIRQGKVETLAATDPVAQVSDRLQAHLHEGPCYEATTRRMQTYRIADLYDSDSRWPRYRKQARELGIGSVMGFLLYTNGRDNFGALDLYSSDRGAFDGSSEHVGWVLASHAAVALSSARHDQNLTTALASSRLIGEAIGVVMARHVLTEEAAFDLIRRVSQDRNTKVRELARVIVTIGELP
jgi:hypothetical protein